MVRIVYDDKTILEETYEVWQCMGCIGSVWVV